MVGIVVDITKLNTNYKREQNMHVQFLPLPMQHPAPKLSLFTQPRLSMVSLSNRLGSTGPSLSECHFHEGRGLFITASMVSCKSFLRICTYSAQLHLPPCHFDFRLLSRTGQDTTWREAPQDTLGLPSEQSHSLILNVMCYRPFLGKTLILLVLLSTLTFR